MKKKNDHVELIKAERWKKNQEKSGVICISVKLQLVILSVVFNFHLYIVCCLKNSLEGIWIDRYLSKQ